MLRTLVGVLAFSLLALTAPCPATAALSQPHDLCDHNGDDAITAVDALTALDHAVMDCVRSYQCDEDGNGEDNVTDALALLRFAVHLPVDLVCDCFNSDECFHTGEDDCIDHGPSNSICWDFQCVECEFSEDCGDGFFCEPCKKRCVPEQ